MIWRGVLGVEGELCLSQVLISKLWKAIDHAVCVHCVVTEEGFKWVK